MIRVLKFAGIALLALGVASCGGDPEASAPDQPIAFFHSVHAGQNQIPCMYCHTTADRSVDAGIPAVALCVGCHVPGSAVQPPENAQLAFPAAARDTMWNREATKLVDYWRRQEAIPWVRIHDLPEHVKFPHYMHVNAGLQCQTCHGPVQEMEKVYQFASLEMGWCVDCHRGESPLSEAEEAAVRSNSSYVRKIAALSAAGGDARGAQLAFGNQRASTDCFVCHY
ncbi:MAG TPA: cytochrome c3 family protein [Longimicrobiaceae bacterium]|nr:cytochrome c3 family protein [Longimicrobiaceae bacterium]